METKGKLKMKIAGRFVGLLEHQMLSIPHTKICGQKYAIPCKAMKSSQPIARTMVNALSAFRIVK